MEFKKTSKKSRNRQTLNAPLGSNSSFARPPATKPPRPAKKISDFIRTTKRAKPTQVTKKASSNKTKTIASVEPAIDSQLQNRRSGLSKKLVTIIVITVVTVAVAGALAAKPTIKHFTPVDSRSETTPEFQTVTPKNKSISQLGGWKRVSPPKSDPVFSYSDVIGGTPVGVSQQPLPQSFKGDIDNQVAELAKKFNATTKIDAGGIKVYVGTSAKGPQSAILAKNNLLILIKSQEKVADDKWATYVESLK